MLENAPKGNTGKMKIDKKRFDGVLRAPNRACVRLRLTVGYRIPTRAERLQIGNDRQRIVRYGKSTQFTIF